MSGLNDMQVQLVQANASDIDKNVRPEFHLDWKKIKFVRLLGSGTFGDCYLGIMAARDVAIKKMRAGLIDKAGFESFCKEVVMLAKLDHENIVTFKGYVLEPALLIVMDFVAGGTLSAFVKSANESGAPPDLKTTMRILEGCARALEYLHAMPPAPILHRDIKSENILLTEDFEAKIADLGEARAVSRDQAMTIVSRRLQYRVL